MKKLGVLLVLLALALTTLACGESSGYQGSSTTSGSSSTNTHTVIYEVTGTAPYISITMENGTGGTDQGDYKLPFKHSFVGKPGDFLYISAQMGGSGSIDCAIKIDGEVAYKAHASGEYSICSVSGLLPY